MRLLFELDKQDYGACTHTFTRNSARSIIVRDGKIANECQNAFEPLRR